MKSLFKFILWSVGLVVILVMAVGVAVISMDPNEHKDWIISQAEKNLGRTVALDGQLSLTVYPWLGLEVNDITVGNAPGFGPAPFLRADYIHLRVKFMPLLKEMYEVDTVQIHGAEINLETNDQGVTNWQDLVRNDNQQSSLNLPLAAIVLGGVDIKEASFLWDDQSAGKEYRISNLGLSVGDLIYGEPIQISLGMDLDSSSPALTGNANLEGTVSYDLDNGEIMVNPLQFMSRLQGETVPGGQTELAVSTSIRMDIENDTLSISDLTFSALDTRMVGDIDLSEASTDHPYVEAGLEVEGGDLSYWFKLLGIEPLATQIADLSDRQFKFQTKISADRARGDIDIPEITASLLGATIRGGIKATDIQSETPGYEGNLVASGPDLPTLLQVIGQFETGEAPQLAEYGRKMSAMAQRDKAFSAEASFEANMKSGDINIPNLSFNGVGLTMEGEFVAKNFGDGKGDIDASLELVGSDLNQWLGLMEIESLDALKNNTLDRKFSFQSSISADLSRGDVDIPQLTANLLGADIKGRIKTSNLQSDDRQFSGMINATGPNLPALMQVAGDLGGNEESSLSDYGKKLNSISNSQKSFSINSSFDADMGSGDISVPEITFKGIGLNVKGNLTTKGMIDNNGTVDGRLVVTGQNLSGVLKAIEQENIAEVLQNIRIDTGINGTRSNINLRPLAINAIFSGDQIPNSPVKLEVNASTNINLDKEQLSLDTLSVKGLGLNIAGSLRASNIMDAPNFNGRVNVNPFNLRTLMNTLNMDIPETADNSVFAKAAFSSDFAGSASNVSFEDMRLQLDDTNILGKLDLSDFENPSTSFDIRIDRMNLDRYMAPVVEGESAQVVTPEAAAGAAAQLPIETLRSLNTDGSLSIDEFIVANLKVSDVKLGLNAKDGTIKLAPASANLYEGSYLGDINLNATGRVPRLTVNSSLNNVEIAPLLFDYMGKASLAGRSNISLALFGLGSDTATLKSSLSGQGSVTLGKGVLYGIDVKALLDQLEIMIESKDTRQKVDKGEFTNFDSFDLTFNMNSGVAMSESFLLKAPGFNVTGAGTLADLNTNTIRYDLSVSVDESHAVREEEDYNLGGYSIPVKCRGQLNEPDCKPEYGSIIATIIQKAVLEKVFGNRSGEATAPTETEADPGKALLNNALEGLFGR